MLMAGGQAFAADENVPPAGQSRFLFVPYPITEPAVGSGLLAGPVWMRDGPTDQPGPSKPQAFGFGALWTDGGSRGVVAFDHRAWRGGVWRSTAIAGSADIVLTYSGLSPREDQARGFTIHGQGASLAAERRLGQGPNSMSFRLFSANTSVVFNEAVPSELSGKALDATIAGIGIEWSRDTRDQIFTPTKGHAISIGLTIHPRSLGSSFDAQSINAKWTRYGPLPIPGTLGFRVQADASFGAPPFYLRPYVSLRGIPAMRYSGERVASVEAEYRLPVNERWDVLAFSGMGWAHADVPRFSESKSVSAVGVGVCFKVQKLFGLTFGIDLAQGPDGSVGYVQIGNAWSK
jgi:hypothetical protein